MDLKSLVRQLANRINQPHVIESYIRKVFNAGIEEGKKKSMWISIDEKLPKEQKGVFFIVKWKDGGNGYFVGIYNGNGCFEYDRGIFLSDSLSGKVTHWMYIPYDK